MNIKTTDVQITVYWKDETPVFPLLLAGWLLSKNILFKNKISEWLEKEILWKLFIIFLHLIFLVKKERRFISTVC